MAFDEQYYLLFSMFEFPRNLGKGGLLATGRVFRLYTPAILDCQVEVNGTCKEPSLRLVSLLSQNHEPDILAIGGLKSRRWALFVLFRCQIRQKTGDLAPEPYLRAFL